MRCNAPTFLTSAVSARSRDGVVLIRGSVVWCIYTRDGGVTWNVTDSMVVRHTNRQGMVCFEEKPRTWCAGGDNRIFKFRELAIEEATRRNQRTK